MAEICRAVNLSQQMFLWHQQVCIHKFYKKAQPSLSFFDRLNPGIIGFLDFFALKNTQKSIKSAALHQALGPYSVRYDF